MTVSCQSPEPSLSSNSNIGTGEWVRRSQPHLGTFVTISVYGHSKEKLHSIIDGAFEEFESVDLLMSVHRQDSELSEVNRRAAKEPVPVSDALWEVLSTAQRIAETTDGAFDVTIRPVADLWGFLWKEYRLPTEQELREVLPKVNYRLVRLNPEDQTVAFAGEGVSIDLGGIAKGYAVDCAFERLKLEGVSIAMVRAGGDMRVLGLPPGENHWVVQLEDPEKEGHRVRVKLSSGAISTSGNYENFFIINGRRYSHLLNPRTGMPVQGMAACSLIAPRAMWSDAWATACFVMGAEKSIRKLDGRFPVRFTLMPMTGEEDPEHLPVLQTPDFPLDSM